MLLKFSPEIGVSSSDCFSADSSLTRRFRTTLLLTPLLLNLLTLLLLTLFLTLGFIHLLFC